jgi:hypothetical protein
VRRPHVVCPVCPSPTLISPSPILILRASSPLFPLQQTIRVSPPADSGVPPRCRHGAALSPIPGTAAHRPAGLAAPSSRYNRHDSGWPSGWGRDHRWKRPPAGSDACAQIPKALIRGPDREYPRAHLQRRTHQPWQCEGASGATIVRLGPTTSGWSLQSCARSVAEHSTRPPKPTPTLFSPVGRATSWPLCTGLPVGTARRRRLTLQPRCHRLPLGPGPYPRICDTSPFRLGEST